MGYYVDDDGEAIEKALSSYELGAYHHLFKLVKSDARLSITNGASHLKQSHTAFRRFVSKLCDLGLLTIDSDGNYHLNHVEFGSNWPKSPSVSEKKVIPWPIEPISEADIPKDEPLLVSETPEKVDPVKPQRRNKTFLSGASVRVPITLDTPEFREAWSAWLDDRAQRGNYVTERAAKMQLNRLAGLPVSDAVHTIAEAIDKGWTTVYPKIFREKEVVSTETQKAEVNWLDEPVDQDTIDFIGDLLGEADALLDDVLLDLKLNGKGIGDVKDLTRREGCMVTEYFGR